LCKKKKYDDLQNEKERLENTLNKLQQNKKEEAKRYELKLSQIQAKNDNFQSRIHDLKNDNQMRQDEQARQPAAFKSRGRCLNTLVFLPAIVFVIHISSSLILNY